MKGKFMKRLLLVSSLILFTVLPSLGAEYVTKVTRQDRELEDKPSVVHVVKGGVLEVNLPGSGWYLKEGKNLKRLHYTEEADQLDIVGTSSISFVNVTKDTVYQFQLGRKNVVEHLQFRVKIIENVNSAAKN